ncbi:MAG: SDR family NAD(P)-dependent oxidoreductase, partial [Cytophagales bacterium]|nr:SDR family NAD(P)-dependent oxidoreductase [Cytophagales bacterium]
LMDPQQRIFLEVVWQAIEDAGYKASALSGSNTGLFVGVSSSDYADLLSQSGIAIEAQSATGRAHSILANRVSYLLDLHGPSEPVDTACSSALVAVHRAVEVIRNGTCEMAIAGGVNVMLSPGLYISFSKAGMLCEDGRCKTFDKQANGYVRGEGVGAVLLKPLNKAQSDGDHIYALIKGTAINHGGQASSLTAPNPNAQADLIISAWEKSDVDPSTVTYIEAHGTGTSLGDPVEINGLKKAFKHLLRTANRIAPEKPYCGIGSVKTNIGHLESAAGIAGLLKVLLSMKYKKIPASIHFEELNPYIQLEDSPFYLVTKTKNWNRLEKDKNREIPRRAGVSSFGFGGANAHLVIEEYESSDKALQNSENEAIPMLIVLSAKNEERLRVAADRLIRFIEDTGESHLKLADVAYTLQTGREEMNARLAIIANNFNILIEKLRKWVQNDDVEDIFRGNVKTDKSKAKLLIDGRAGAEYLRIVVNERDYSKIANLWVSGIEIDWRLLYCDFPPEISITPSHPRKISLPTYPFERERHWIPLNKTGMTYSKTVRLKPLIDGINPGLSLGKGIVFQKHIQSDDPIINDYWLNEKPAFPVSMYMEMAFEAASQVLEKRAFKLSRITILNQSALGGTENRVNIAVEKAREEYTFEINTLVNSNTVVLAKGSFYSLKQPGRQLDFKIPVEDLKSKAATFAKNNEYYSNLEKFRIHFGASDQLFKQIRMEHDFTLIEYEIPLQHRRAFKQFVVYPFLVEAGLQATIARELSDQEFRTIASIEAAEAINMLRSKGFIYVKSNSDSQYEVSITDIEGLLCARFRIVKSAKDRLCHFFYQAKWKAQHQTIQPVDNIENEKETKVLIVHSKWSGGLDRVLLQAHEKAHKLDSSRSKDYDNGLKDLSDVQTIYFISGMQNPSETIDNLNMLDRSLEAGIMALFKLVKSIMQQGLSGRTVALKIVTNRVYALGGEKTQPYGADLLGFAKVLAKEYASLQVSCLDIDLDIESAEEDIQKIGRLIINQPADHNGNEVCIRGGKRYRRVIESIRLPATKGSYFKEEGVYLIVGGTGGIGLALSRYLAQKYKVKLVLVGQSRLNKQKKSKIAEIESFGAKTFYIQADCKNLSQMRKVLRSAKSRFGLIHGIIHSAMVLRDQLIENMDEGSFREAFDPKVRGSAVLAQALGSEPLDFLLFFSSIQSFSGGPGQANYVAGCAFKDAYAAYLENERSYPIKTINWGFWGSVGGATDDYYNELFSSMGVLSIEPDEGMEAIERVLMHPKQQVISLKAEDRFLSKSGINVLKPTTNFELQDSERSDTALPDTTGVLSAIVSDITGISMDQLEPDMQWTELGVDSIVSMKIIREIEDKLRLRLYPNELVEHDTLGKLFDYLTQEIEKTTPDQLSQKPDGNLSNASHITDYATVMADNTDKTVKPIIYLLSTPRAGSTLLRVMLMGNSHLFAPPELHLLPFTSLKSRKEELIRSNQAFFREGLIETIRELAGIETEDAIQKMQQ